MGLVQNSNFDPRKGSLLGIGNTWWFRDPHLRKARKLRVEFPGAIHHAMNHEDRREPIFQDDTDRERFLATLGAMTLNH
jgi:hypothetical protein